MERQGDGWNLSLLAGATGIGVCVGLLLVGYYGLPQFAYFLAIPFAIGSGGVIIGLIDRRRPYVTILAATALAAIALLVYPHWVSDLTAPTALVASAVGALLFAALIGLLAAAGVAAVAEARKAHPRLAWVLWSIFALLLVGVFILPWARLQQRGRMFMMSHKSDVRAFLMDRIIALPQTELSWRPGPSRDPVRGSFGAEFTTTWEATTQIAGPGRCTLRFEVRSLKRDRPVEVAFKWG